MDVGLYCAFVVAQIAIGYQFIQYSFNFRSDVWKAQKKEVSFKDLIASIKKLFFL